MDNLLFVYGLIHQPVLDVGPARICARQIADEFFRRCWGLVWIVSEDIQKRFRFGTEADGSRLFNVLQSLCRVDDLPHYQSISREHSSSGVASPSRMDSRMPGVLERYSVSWIERQSSSETRTALPRLPVMTIGSCDVAVSSISLYSLDLASVFARNIVFHFCHKLVLPSCRSKCLLSRFGIPVSLLSFYLLLFLSFLARAAPNIARDPGSR